MKCIFRNKNGTVPRVTDKVEIIFGYFMYMYKVFCCAAKADYQED